MPPVQLALQVAALHFARSQINDQPFVDIRSQWENPQDILTILMIIGGDVVQRAIAQLAGVGRRYPFTPFAFTPVAFSFGWVAYAFSAIVSAAGDHRLMPPPDCDCILVNAKSGQSRTVKSWTLARLVRDYEPEKRDEGGLRVTFFRVRAAKTFGIAEWDWVFYTSSAVILLQIGIACIPGAVSGNWVVLILTVGGTLLAQLGSALPQWGAEKWKARQSHGKRTVVCLTRGNGSHTVLVIVSDGDVGLRFEDLAGGREAPHAMTVPATVLLAGLWIVHLITTQGLSDDAWYLLIVGALGMAQNLIAAGARREPGALGIPLEELESVHKNKVFNAIQEAEAKKEGRRVGLSLLDVFFPGGLQPEERAWREQREEEIKEIEAEERRGRESRGNVNNNSACM